MNIILAVLTAYVFWSFVEYVAHRWPMHHFHFAHDFLGGIFTDTFHSHAVLHHGRFYKNFVGDPDPAARHISMALSASVHILGTIWLWWPLWYVWPAAAIAIPLMGAAQAALWTAVHREMHEPANRWFAKTRYYQFICAAHRTHHEHPSTNFNAALPLMDFLFGTYRSPTVRA